MGVRLILLFSWMFVVEIFDGICDIFEHGKVDEAGLGSPNRDQDLGSIALSNIGKWYNALSGQL